MKNVNKNIFAMYRLHCYYKGLAEGNFKNFKEWIEG